MDPTIAFGRTSDGVTIAYTSIGDPVGASAGARPTLVHLPGVPFSNFVAEWQIPVLRQTFGTLGRELRFLQFDGRGTGRSQRDVTDFSLDAMERDLDAVAAAAGLERFALLGFYNSVMVAIDYAARHPERVSHLVLFGGSARGWNAMSGQATQALLSLIERDWDTFAESAAHAWLGWPPGEEGRLAVEWFRTATTPAVARATIQTASGIDVTEAMAAVRCPVLVLHRREATVIPIEVSEELAAGFDRGELRVVEGSSASLFFEQPEAIVEEILSFVVGNVRGRGAGERFGVAAGAGPVADARSGRRTGTGSAAALSPRERQVLRLVAAGESNGEIAGRLGITVNTVERHVANLYRKIDARGRADATAFAIRNGLA